MVKKKSGWPQFLDNGVMDKPESVGPSSRIGEQQRVGKNLDFFGAIDKGSNPHGQTSIVPEGIVRGGSPVGYRQYNWGGNIDGDRWNKNPMVNRNKGDE